MTAFTLLGRRLSRLGAVCCRLEGLMAVFALLSVADFLLTWLLARVSEDCLMEANPLAAWVLEHYGWLGLGLYKAFLVGLVLTLCLVIARRRPGTGRLVCAVGCNSLAVVVCYSLALLLVYPPDARAGAPLDLPDQQVGKIIFDPSAAH